MAAYSAPGILKFHIQVLIMKVKKLISRNGIVSSQSLSNRVFFEVTHLLLAPDQNGLPIGVLANYQRIPEHNQQTTCPGQCHINPFRIVDEAQTELFILTTTLRAHRRNENNHLLLPLELLHGADLWHLHAIICDLTAKNAHLLLVRRNYSHVHWRDAALQQLLVEATNGHSLTRIDPRRIMRGAFTNRLHRVEEYSSVFSTVRCWGKDRGHCT